MTEERLREIIALHAKWLASESGGERADLRWANLRGTDLRGSDLRGVDLRGVDLRDATLTGANPRGADLSGADLRGADLRWADLRGVDLRDATLTGANLRGANLRGADLRGADLSGARIIHLAGLPSGETIFIPTAAGWYLTVGCWKGNLEDFKTLIASDEGWPEARGSEVTRRRPSLQAVAALCEAHMDLHPHVVEKLAEKWAPKETPSEDAS